MRNLKKVLALVIAFSMMLSVVAFANFADVTGEEDFAGAAELLSALEIMVGDENGNFNPDKTISRAEMAAVVCRIKGLEGAAKGAKGETNFDDVAADHWASGYVNTAESNGIIAGYGNGKFGPEDEVTYEQAVRMIVSALGFDPMAVEKGGWPTGYLVVANTYKITAGVSGSTRADVAVLTYNALSTPMMDQTTYGADAEFQILNGKNGREYRTLLTDMDIYIATGVLADTELDDAFFAVTEANDDGEFEADEDNLVDENYVEFKIGDSNIADYQFQNADVYVKKTRKNYEVVAVVASTIGETFALLSDDLTAKTTNKVVEYYVDPANSSKTKTFKVVDTPIVVYNKEIQTTMDVEALAAMEDVELVFIENTGDTYYDVVVATDYFSAIVDSVDANKDKISIGGSSVTLDFDDEELTIILCDDAGNELTLADFAEDDVVAVISDAADKSKVKNFKSYIKIIKLSNAAVEGVVEETYTSNGEDYVVIGGEEIKVDTTAAADVSVSDLKVGDEGIFYVGMTGKVIYFDGSSVGENYAYILESATEDSAFSADIVQVKLLTKNDGIVIYDLTEDASEDFVADYGKADYFGWEATDVKDLSDRLITYKTNAKGEIKSIEAIDSKDYKSVDGIYNDRTQMLDGKTLEDDVIVFVVTETKADNNYVGGLSYLVDDGEYKGHAFLDEDGEYSVLVISEGDSAFSEETGFAIVTRVTTTKDENDEDVTKVSFVQDEVEGSVIFTDEDSANKLDDKDDKAYEGLEVGDVFVYNATADGIVTNYAIIATIEKVSGADQIVLADNLDLKVLFGSENETEIVVSYIANTELKKTTKGETITLGDKLASGDDIISVSAAANKYTYDDSGRNTVIATEDFMATEDTYYYDADAKTATPVLVRLYEDAVLDIYTSNDRISK